MKSALLLIFLLLTTDAVAQSGNKNYMLSRHYKQSGANANDISKVSVQIEYVDGLGRPQQRVNVGQSPTGSDLVLPFSYNEFGRQVKQYLPYSATGIGAFQTGADAGQSAFYTANTAGLDASDLGRPFTETGFELSPLNRPLSTRSPGNKSATSNVTYGANAANEVKRYDYVSNANLLSTVAANGTYAAGTLEGFQKTDENGKVETEYRDKQERLVCRKVIASVGESLFTYYVYDDYGQLRAVLQPMFQDNASLADYAFLYEYDQRGRVVAKKTPGAGVVNIVYDKFDRQALTQDAGQLARGVWEFTKYDALNRIAMTGEVPSASGRAAWQSNLNASQAHHEDKQGSGLGYTLANTLPNVAEANVLTVQYYDDYTFPKPAALAYMNTFGVNVLSSAKGQQTGSRARMLGGAANWLVNVVYFDAEYRVVQNVRELYDLGAGALERISLQYKYDLAAVVAQEKTEQITGAGTNVHLKTFEYDHADRLLSVQEKIVNGNKSREAVTVAQRYNTFGQLQQQWFHSENATHFRRRTNYANNIRGWLTQSKTSYKAKDNVPESAFYNITLAYASGNNYTNGNISQMQWSGKDENTFTRGLSFSYDGANRLLGASGLYNYKEIENGITYDKNGNFKTLIRAGTAVDNLVYANTGNRISTVTDGSGNNAGVKSGASSYSYDANGNMTEDGNRGAVLTYNYLDLPRTVAIGGKTFSYDYDASGKKHKYTADTLTVKYAGDFEYNQSNALKRISVTGGQVMHRGDSLRFDYFLKDHLGNVRIVFDERGRILQQTDYYPFGLEIDRNDPVQTPAARNDINRLTFIRRESQVGTGYIDLQARFYDPGIGRFMGVDPMAEQGRRWNPYNYGFDNPMRFIDPDGMWPEDQGDDPFLIARLVTTAFYDTKHAIINTGARLLGSDIRAGYKVEDGQQVFETQISKQAVDNSLSGQVKEAVNAVADVALVATAGSSRADPGNLLSKTNVESQVVKAGKESVEGVITGYTKHGLNQSIGRDGGRGVKASEMVEAVKNPKKVTTQNNGGIKYDGTGAKVVVNSDGKVISTFGKPRGEVIHSNGKGSNALNRAKELGLEYDPKKIR